MEDIYPELKSRLQSTLIDNFTVIFCMFILSFILDNFKNSPDELRMILLISVLLYEPICQSFGCTIGNYLMGIRVRRISNLEKRPNIFLSIIRFIFKLLLGWLSFLVINMNPQRRAIHDLVSGTIMVIYVRSKIESQELEHMDINS